MREYFPTICGTTGTNISGSFFEVFLKDFAKVLKENDVVEHVFFIIKGLGMSKKKK